MFIPDCYRIGLTGRLSGPGPTDDGQPPLLCVIYHFQRKHRCTGLEMRQKGISPLSTGALLSKSSWLGQFPASFGLDSYIRQSGCLSSVL